MTKAEDDNFATAEELAELLRSQGPQAVDPMEVYATMEAAWQDMVQTFGANTPRAALQDLKWTFFQGAHAAANMLIYTAGQGHFEVGVDQLVKDFEAYDKEAATVLRERRALDRLDGEVATPH
jgi:hypothetical protein